jgi:hypothetical protein
MPNDTLPYKLRSLTRTARDGEPLYWNKDHGWVDKGQATHYTLGQTFLYGEKEDALWENQENPD